MSGLKESPIALVVRALSQGGRGISTGTCLGGLFRRAGPDRAGCDSATPSRYSATPSRYSATPSRYSAAPGSWGAGFHRFMARESPWAQMSATASAPWDASPWSAAQSSPSHGSST